MNVEICQSECFLEKTYLELKFQIQKLILDKKFLWNFTRIDSSLIKVTFCTQLSSVSILQP